MQPAASGNGFTEKNGKQIHTRCQSKHVNMLKVGNEYFIVNRFLFNY